MFPISTFILFKERIGGEGVDRRWVTNHGEVNIVPICSVSVT